MSDVNDMGFAQQIARSRATEGLCPVCEKEPKADAFGNVGLAAEVGTCMNEDCIFEAVCAMKQDLEYRAAEYYTNRYPTDRAHIAALNQHQCTLEAEIERLKALAGDAERRAQDLTGKLKDHDRRLRELLTSIPAEPEPDCACAQMGGSLGLLIWLCGRALR